MKRRDVGGWAKDRGVGGDSKRGGVVIIRELGSSSEQTSREKETK